MEASGSERVAAHPATIANVNMYVIVRSAVISPLSHLSSNYPQRVVDLVAYRHTEPSTVIFTPYEDAVSVAGITTNCCLSVARTHDAKTAACFLLKHHLLRDSVVHFERQRKTFAGILGSEIKLAG